jgi:LacI family transcriptional regulator, repressor for deo operon, udp, cdd, tsx, nupC, and nupG
MRRPRLQDVAAQAGVSEATVSRVLNGKPGVGEETRLQVLTALDVLGYERPAALRSASAGLIGLVVPELVNPIFPAFAQMIESGLAGHRYTPVLCTQTPGGVTEDEYVEMLLARGVSGIIFISGLHADSTADPGRYHALTERGLPIVLVNGYLPGLDAPFLSCDDATGVDLSVGHLAALGHRRIGLAMGPARYVPARRKLEGFHAAMRRHLDPAPTHDEITSLVEWTIFTADGGADATAALLDRGVTAVVCGSDVMAYGAIRVARARGLRLPEDLSLVGSDDNPVLDFVDPPLTTVRQPVLEISAAAVRALLDELAGSPAPRAEYMFRPELVVRGSTMRPPRRGAVSSRRVRKGDATLR